MFNLPVYILVLCTAYTASFDECGKTDGITASGAKATINRTVAADDLPLGTRIRINGQEYIVEDRFGGGYKIVLTSMLIQKRKPINMVGNTIS